ncbi:hypothetical protein TNCV_3071041 [Trichonephila clavipes]|nr:hypothetical protein TNCV_3071041 [Trichonephila clavipes]
MGTKVTRKAPGSNAGIFVRYIAHFTLPLKQLLLFLMPPVRKQTDIEAHEIHRGKGLESPALVIQRTRVSDPMYSVCTRGYLVTLGIEPRPSGLESDALTTRLPTAIVTVLLLKLNWFAKLVLRLDGVESEGTMKSGTRKEYLEKFLSKLMGCIVVGVEMDELLVLSSRHGGWLEEDGEGLLQSV